MVSDKRSVAIIDDDGGLRSALKKLLAAKGYGTELFSSSEEFLTASTSTEAACLIVDIQLPGVSGVELSQLLKAKGINLPTIFITASQDPLVRAEALKLGCVAYLQKPFRAKQLIAAIDLALGRPVGT